ncbi:hypothetical protein BOTBODRAFT_27055 [Botryobasidium botryosum FD-172 SS1]|uniref:H/ACA ribonucleoprotein complex subunit 2 n=1 Tax=Botryobasidium botryosum (strain FD-172 SS1) TaxID=930990 RepID=A0A067NB76_BOTB1|nr:hypothetical protein BOTBODRAFT_27055 [Botryobasidium botryosum FD-172 SS1]
MSKDQEKAEKKAKKERRKSQATADVEMVEIDAKEESTSEKKTIVVPVEELSPIAHPMAGKKLAKRLHRTIRKASKQRQVKRGVKEVVKSIRKGEKGLLILAADITPIDIISHMPLLSEEAGIPYVFVPSKEELGHAGATKRPTSCILICPDQKKKKKQPKEGETAKAEEEEDYREAYDECLKEVKELDESITY